MKHKASISHDTAIIQELRDDTEFVTEYLKAAMEESNEQKVLPIAQQHLAESRLRRKNSA
jgi:DNA-binding phage protein